MDKQDKSINLPKTTSGNDKWTTFYCKKKDYDHCKKLKTENI